MDHDWLQISLIIADGWRGFDALGVCGGMPVAARLACPAAGPAGVCFGMACFSSQLNRRPFLAHTRPALSVCDSPATARLSDNTTVGPSYL